MEWLSVKDRLPEQYEEVLCLDIDKDIFVGYMTWEDCWSDGEYDGINVTHWMPLPEPPKGE